MKIRFAYISDEASMAIIFSLNCTSTGGSADSVVWTRDGFSLSNTGRLILTNGSTLSYTSVLVVNDRTPGTYTCTVRGASDQILNSTNFTVQGMGYRCRQLLIDIFKFRLSSYSFSSSCGRTSHSV